MLALSLSAQAVFIDPVPADATVACRADVPTDDSMLAQVPLLPVGLDTIVVFPVDSLAAANDECSGQITRTWTIPGLLIPVTATQIIEYRDTIPPDYARPPDTMFSCRFPAPGPAQTGEPSALSDNCTPADELLVTFSDSLTSDSTCASCFILFRTWRVEDACGNGNEQLQTISIRDTVRPSMICVPAQVFVDPSGLTSIALTPEDIDGGSTDNCAIRQLSLSLNSVDCSQLGEAIPIALTAVDSSGNFGTCATTVTVNPLTPEPTSSNMVCGGDTLKLVANPPTPTVGDVSPYTFRWFGPFNNLISTQENPIIPQANEMADGPYRVEIRGTTGCTSDGIVDVQIGDLPVTPTLQASAETVCEGDTVRLISLSSYTGDVRFRWFRGTPVNPIALGETTTGFFNTPFPEGLNLATYFLIAEVDGCSSAPSDQVLLQSVPQPVIRVVEDEITACEFENVRLEAQGDPDLNYRWTSPSGIVFPGQILDLDNVNPTDAGTYRVVAFDVEACQSEPGRVDLTVNPAPAPATISGPTGVCPGTDFTLEANGTGDAYLFIGPSGQEILSDRARIELTNANASIAGAWRVQLREGDCFGQPGPALQIRLLENPTPAASVNPDPVCEGNTLSLATAALGPGASYSWMGPNGFNQNTRTVNIPDVSRSFSGDYVLTVTNADGCMGTAATRVNVLRGISIEAIQIEGNDCVLPGDAVRLIPVINPDLGPGGYEYDWTTPVGGTSTSPNLILTDFGPAANGNYQLEVENAVGCVSPSRTIDLVLNLAPARRAQPFNATSRYDRCVGETLRLETNAAAGSGARYTWEGPGGFQQTTDENFLDLELTNADQSGDYRVVVTLDGCSSAPSQARTINVTAIPEISAALIEPVCAGGDIEFTADDLPGLDYAWTGPGSFTASSANATISNASATAHNGNYTLIVSRNSCPAVPFRFEVEVQDLPERPVLASPAAVCVDLPGAELIVDVVAEEVPPLSTYRWTTVGTNLDLGTTTTPQLRIDDLGVFGSLATADILVTTEINGCESLPSLPQQAVLSRTFGQAAAAGMDTTICTQTYQLRGTDPAQGTGRWTQIQEGEQADILNVNAPESLVNNLSPDDGPYVFVWTLSNGACTDFSADTVVVTISPPEQADAGPSRVACIGERVTLAAVQPLEAGATGRWSQRETQELLDVTIVDPTDPDTEILGLRTDNIYSFTWTTSGRCGESSDVIAVSVSDPNPRAGGDLRVCAEEPTVNLQAAAPSLGSTGQWFSVIPGPEFSNPNGSGTSLTNLMPGPNEIVWELDEGVCGDRSRDTLTVEFIIPPLPQDDEYEVPFQGSVTFDPAENDVNPDNAEIFFAEVADRQGQLFLNSAGEWTFTAGFNFVGTVRVSYQVETDGCEPSAAEVTFLVGGDASCEVPNIFTPNQDGTNDFFVIPCLLDATAFPRSTVSVFNQWGDEVFASGSPYQNDWAGTFQGGDLPVGTYFYFVNLGDGSGTMSGHVRIER